MVRRFVGEPHGRLARRPHPEPDVPARTQLAPRSAATASPRARPTESPTVPRWTSRPASESTKVRPSGDHLQTILAGQESLLEPEHPEERRCRPGCRARGRRARGGPPRRAPRTTAAGPPTRTTASSSSGLDRARSGAPPCGDPTWSHSVACARYCDGTKRLATKPSAVPATVIATISHLCRSRAARYRRMLTGCSSPGPCPCQSTGCDSAHAPWGGTSMVAGRDDRGGLGGTDEESVIAQQSMHAEALLTNSPGPLAAGPAQTPGSSDCAVESRLSRCHNTRRPRATVATGCPCHDCSYATTLLSTPLCDNGSRPSSSRIGLAELSLDDDRRLRRRDSEFAPSRLRAGACFPRSAGRVAACAERGGGGHRIWWWRLP